MRLPEMTMFRFCTRHNLNVLENLLHTAKTSNTVGDAKSAQNLMAKITHYQDVARTCHEGDFANKDDRLSYPELGRVTSAMQSLTSIYIRYYGSFEQLSTTERGAEIIDHRDVATLMKPLYAMTSTPVGGILVLAGDQVTATKLKDIPLRVSAPQKSTRLNQFDRLLSVTTSILSIQPLCPGR